MKLVSPIHFVMNLYQLEFGWACELHSDDNNDLSVTVKTVLLKELIAKDLFLVLAEQRREKELSFLKRGFGTASMSGIDKEFL